MLAKLQNDTFIFSGLRTHAQLLEASSLLLNEKGQIRNFDSFANEFNKINKNYNQNYLDAEYQFAISSSQSAANWAALDENSRYDLQYRTANDDRVRDSHRILHNITLPVRSEFWLYYYPPNGWRCRCTAVEVIKAKYEVFDSNKAIELGKQATTQIGPDGKNRLEIFRFNPGAEQKVFPPKHPYNKVKGAEKVKEVIEDKLDYETLYKSAIFASNMEDLSEEMRNTYPKIDVEKINAINMYSGYYYGEINNFNRGKINKVELLPDYGITEEFYRVLTKTINKGLDEIPDKYEGTTYRGTELTREQMQPYFDALKTGKPHSEMTFMSSSYLKSEAFDGNVSFQIKSKTGTMIEKISEKKFEKEVLFKAGQKFNVIKIDEYDGDVWHVYLEEI